MNIVYFKDTKADYFKLAFLKNVEELRCGILSLREKVEVVIAKLKIPKNYKIYINSNLLITEEVKNFLEQKKYPIILTKNNRLVIAILKDDNQLNLQKLIKSPEKIEVKNDCLIDYPWELIYKNFSQIEIDFKMCKKNFKKIRANVYCGKNVKIEQGVYFNTEKGPIIIDDEAIIMANSVIVGPVYIGKKSIIKALSKIYSGTSIGPMCKIGGEVEETIFQGFSNKQHEGFLGHSFVGEWVNVGAGTNNSDLKNNYKTVKMRIKNKTFETNRLFLGAIIGDHTKIGINTMLNTGTFIGISCNIFGAGYMPKYIAPFSWGGPDRFEKYDLGKALETAKISMNRRNVLMDKEYELSFRKAYRLS